MEVTKQKLWTKDFLIISLINFMITLIFFLLMVTIAGYAVDEFNATTSTAGLVSSIVIIGSLIGRLGAGRFIGEWGSKKTLFIGLLAFMISTGLYFVAINLPILMINRLLQGIGLGIASTATGTIIAQIIPPTRRGEGIGYFSLSAILSAAIGPFIGIFLTHFFDDFNLIFLVNFVMSVVGFAMFFIVKVPDAPKAKKEISTKLGFKISNFIEPNAVPISIVALVIGFAYSGVMSFMTFYAKELDLVATGGYFFLVYAFVVLLSRPFTGKLLDVRGANIVVFPCLIIFSIGMFAFSQATSGIVLLLAAALIGIGYGNFNSAAQAIAIKVTPNERLGLATSTYFIFFDLGLGVGPYLQGMFVPTLGYSTVFFAMVFVILLAILLYYILYGKNETKLQKVTNA